jgi:hypothetical protein
VLYVSVEIGLERRFLNGDGIGLFSPAKNGAVRASGSKPPGTEVDEYQD